MWENSPLQFLDIVCFGLSTEKSNFGLHAEFVLLLISTEVKTLYTFFFTANCVQLNCELLPLFPDKVSQGLTDKLKFLKGNQGKNALRTGDREWIWNLIFLLYFKFHSLQCLSTGGSIYDFRKAISEPSSQPERCPYN